MLEFIILQARFLFESTIAKFASTWTGPSSYHEAVAGVMTLYLGKGHLGAFEARLDLIFDKGGELDINEEEWQEVNSKGAMEIDELANFVDKSVLESSPTESETEDDLPPAQDLVL